MCIVMNVVNYIYSIACKIWYDARNLDLLDFSLIL